jgi:hypothetical protein
MGKELQAMNFDISPLHDNYSLVLVRFEARRRRIPLLPFREGCLSFVDDHQPSSEGDPSDSDAD